MPGTELEFDTTVFLDPSGALTRPLPAALQERDELLSLYRVMVLTRLFDHAAIKLQRTGALGTYPSCEGQEAIGAGLGLAMQPRDVLVPYYRDIATQVQRGTLPEEILLYWGGDERGSNFSGQPDDFPICVPIATQCCHAVGVAYAIKYRGEARAVAVTLGDGATSKGDFYESINVAGAMQLPVVFLVNNNQWAISVPLEKQTGEPELVRKAVAAGIEGYRVDGNDPVAVYQVLHEALERARSASEPALVEAVTYRLCDHTTADDASRYRPREEFDAARELEPLVRFKAFLENDYQWTPADEASLREDCEREVKRAVEAYQGYPEQAPGEFFDHMYASPTAELQRQKAEWLAGVRRHG